MTSTSLSKVVFTPIDDGIWFIEGTKTKKADEQKHPTLILVFTWMGALLHQLQRYAEKYRELYPGADQVFVQIEFSFFWSSQPNAERRLKPLAQFLLDRGCIPPTEQRILVHCLSNGGGMTMHTLARLLPSSKTDQQPTSALVLDSAPGSTNQHTFTQLFLTSINNAGLRFFAGILIRAFYLSLAIPYQLGLAPEDPLELLSNELLKDRLLPWMDLQTPRLFIYSKNDTLIPWESVQEHVEKARTQGFDVREERYETSTHVSHAREDPERYWDAVQRLWEDATKASERRKEREYKL